MTPIYDEFVRQKERLARAYIAPTLVVFSREGYRKAAKEAHRNSMYIFDAQPDRYCGLPFEVDPEAQDEIKVKNAMTTSRRGPVTVKLDFDGANGQVLVDGMPYGDPITVAQLVGSQMDKAQICDLCQAWLNATDVSEWDDFQRGLSALIQQHGTFE